MKKLFGTDGIRGLANEYPMTPEVAMAVGRAVAYLFQNTPELQGRTSLPVSLRPLESNQASRRAKIVVGKDTRLSGYMIEQALASGICSMGADVILIGPLPTPGVAYITHSIRADAGIMISASHNAYEDNGIKIFSSDGTKLPDLLEQKIEELVHGEELKGQSLRPTGDLVGKAFRLDDVHYRYVVHLKSLFANDLDLIGFKIALDCANGAAYKAAPLVFEELGAQVNKTGVSPTGLNINSHCGALHPQNVAFNVIRHRSDIGISLDGDGDRLILVDEKGEVVDGDQVLGMCAIHLKKKGLLTNDVVVTTPMSNGGLEVALNKHGIKMVRSKVGDRHVIEKMRELGSVFGGEQSGHLIFKDVSTTGDGILAALKVLEIMSESGEPLSVLKKSVELFPQVVKAIKVKEKKPLEEAPRVQKAMADAEQALGSSGRVFVRYSGTESVLRILLEGPDSDVLQRHLTNIQDAVEKDITV